ncbi:hypothetical protein GJR96_02865 [Haloferax sp. MBLA0076]|uniref:Lipoprotein n=1 Tax=Haloferax litoreum TaxID=2666140 RepID=A0A6A8GCJ9_9EURY|nr:MULTISPECIES: hypothetical protein [Haloferax]KAB1192435.1 hypothetical protein Hfx1148_02855 [Haloferax sp. CBA1148]MRX20903.1 hypothetical protein [Haloferax litoreum]
MNRRSILAGVASLCASLAGCAANDEGDDGRPTTETTTATPTPTPSEPVLAGQSIAPVSTDECPADGKANVPAIENGIISVEGCLWGASGCSVVRLAAVEYDAESNTAAVVVETVEETAPDEECTQALVPLGYRVELRFKFQLPGEVVVVHDDVNGRRTVARREVNT